jgi:hypothetical protein
VTRTGGGTHYAWRRRRAATGPLTELDRRVAAAIADGCPARARPVARHLGLTSWSEIHLSLVRLEANGVVLVDHDRHGTGRLAPDIAVIAGDVYRMRRIPSPPGGTDR